MAIYFDEKNKLFHLQTPETSYIFFILRDVAPVHLYYGKKLTDLEGIISSAAEISNGASGWSGIDYDLAREGERGYNTESLPLEYSFYGSIDSRKPSFHAQYEDGSRITKMKYKSHKIYSSKPKLSGLPATYTEQDSEADTLELVMFDELTGLELTYRYSVFNTLDAITRNVEVKNTGNNRINLKSVMSCNVDFYGKDYDFVHLQGSWARERHIEKTSLFTGRTQIESRRGSSSHHHSPFFALSSKNACETFGDVYGFSLVYSGNFEAGVEVNSEHISRAYMGINSFDFNWLLESGECFTAPETVMVYSAEGFGKMSRTYHKLYRTRLARGKYRDAQRPVLINNWEATYFNFDEDKIVDIAKTAKKAGIELMVLDDGWFGKRNSDNCSLGDWIPDKNKLPNGIDGLARRVEELGMKFGLWFEPEMVSPDSDLYRAHPDWCLHVNNRGRSEGRNQLILDLSREDVCQYITKSLSDILSTAPISYVKWDMNRNMSEIGSDKLPPERQAEVAHRYMLGLYKILDNIMSQFPDVLFEGCSGGGGRFDAGMMHYFSQYWTSDDTDAVERLFIQEGTSLVMPPLFMGAHVSAVPNHQVGRTTPLKMRGEVAFCGQFGYELDVTKMSDEELCEIAEQVKFYKSIRSVIHNGDMYRIKSPYNSNEVVWEFISEDKNTVILACFMIKCTPYYPKSVIKLQGLEDNVSYRLRNTDKLYSSDILSNFGIHAPLSKDYDSCILIFDKIEK